MYSRSRISKVRPELEVPELEVPRGATLAVSKFFGTG
jgi:hypothetical protein